MLPQGIGIVTSEVRVKCPQHRNRQPVANLDRTPLRPHRLPRPLDGPQEAGVIPGSAMASKSPFVPAGLTPEQVEAALTELGIDGDELLELGGWRTWGRWRSVRCRCRRGSSVLATPLHAQAYKRPAATTLSAGKNPKHACFWARARHWRQQDTWWVRADWWQTN